jgi:hypothetical protein
MHITIVVEPPRPAFGARSESGMGGSHKARYYRRLADQIGSINGAAVDIVEDYLGNVEPGGVVLLDASTAFPATLAECSTDQQSSLPPRTVLVNADRKAVLPLLNEYRLAGAIDEQRFFLWTTESHPDFGYGLYGRCSVAEALDAEQIGDGPFRSGDYCIFGSDRFDGLVHLLVAYLERYTQEEFIPIE